jgi:type IV pilus assembly protein PilE
MTRTRGFTLIELLIVVAIIAILAAIAVPAYSRYTFRSRRADGQQLLLTIANAEERYYATYNKYGALTDIGYSASPTLSANQFYSATVLVPAGSSSQAYTATATPVGAQDTDICGPLTVNSAGLKTPTPASASSNANGNCW